MANVLLERAKKFKEFLAQEDDFQTFLENRDKVSLVLDNPEAWEAFQEILGLQEGTPAKKAKSKPTAKVATKSSKPAKSKTKPGAAEVELPDDISDQVMNALDGHEKGMNLKELADTLGIEAKTALKPILGKLIKSKALKIIRPGVHRRSDVVVKRGRKAEGEKAEEPAPAKSDKPHLKAVTPDVPKIDGRAKPATIEECNERLAAKPAPPPKIKKMLQNSKKAFLAAMRIPTHRGPKAKAVALKAAKAFRGKGGGDKRKSPLQQAGK